MTKKFCTSCGSMLTEDGKCSNPSCVKSKVAINEAAIKNSFAKIKEQVTTVAKEGVDTAQDYMHQSSYESNSAQNVQIKDLFGKNNKSEEIGRNIVPDCVDADSGEVPIRQYDMVRLRSWLTLHFAEGRLQITNKRVIFRTTGRSGIGETSSEYEFALEEIAGIEMKKDPVFYLIPVIISSLVALYCGSAIFSILGWIGLRLSIKSFITVFEVLLALVCMILPPILIPKQLGNPSLMLKYSLAILGLMISFLAGQSWLSVLCIPVVIYHASKLIFVPGVSLELKTKGASPAISIRRKRMFTKLQGDDSGFTHVLPGPDYEKAVKELGALLREIQTGTYPQM